MDFTFKVYFQIDSEIPGDSGKRSKTITVEAERMDDACEYVYDKYSNDSEYIGYELYGEKNEDHVVDFS